MENDIKQIWKDVKELDAQIRTMEKPTKDYNRFIIEVGIFESLGESGGDILTLTYNEEPEEKEIVGETKQHLIEMFEDLQDSLLSYREEQQIKVLFRILK